MELYTKFEDIYQFTIILIFAIALIFFSYMYDYSQELRKSVLEEEKAKQKLLENEIELMKADLENERLEHEERKRREQNLILEQEILLKNKELTTTTLLVNQHNQTLKNISQKLEELKKESSTGKTAVKDINSLIRGSSSMKNDWDTFRIHFEQVHPSFFKILVTKHPILTQTDLRHCAYMRMKLSTKEISRLLNISPTSVQMSRVRLKKKMKLTKEIDLRNYIIQI